MMSTSIQENDNPHSYPLAEIAHSSYPHSTSSLDTPSNHATNPSGFNSTEDLSGNIPLDQSVLNDVEAEAGTSRQSGTKDDAPFHVFSQAQKWNIVYLVSLAGSFSPLSSNIYFPAINTISSELGVSSSLVALTITVYMIVQGIAPSLFGAVSDTSGRRLTFVVLLVVYTAANLGLSFTANYPMLLALRGLQAAGSAATISISTGVIADMASPNERGSFIGTNAGIRMIGQAIGPVIGGVLNSVWGFRSIFWMLFAFSLSVLILLLIFLPETQRKIAGNGSIPLTGFHKPWIYLIRPPKERANTTKPEKPQMPPFSLSKILVPLKYVFEKDIFVLLSWGALVYTLWSMVTSSTTTVLLRTFPSLNQWQVGLCFLPNGIGCVLGSICTGRLLDRTFKQVEAQYKEQHGLETVNIKSTNDFPFERARLPLMPYFSAAFIVSMALYGPSYELNDLRRYFAANLVASLGLQFMIAFTATAIFSINSTMLVDAFSESSAGATATNNLCRCLLGAVGVSVIQPLIHAVKIRNAFLILTGVVLLFSPLIWVQYAGPADTVVTEPTDTIVVEPTLPDTTDSGSLPLTSTAIASKEAGTVENEADDCKVDDGLIDTTQTRGYKYKVSDCEQVPCSGGSKEYIYNFMCYSVCRGRFPTAGTLTDQKTAMFARSIKWRRGYNKETECWVKDPDALERNRMKSSPTKQSTVQDILNGQCPDIQAGAKEITNVPTNVGVKAQGMFGLVFGFLSVTMLVIVV
ncbi:hypothetical protein QQX98_012030 [Neonectria punicea]|uniref:Major facilitator superfamily (MFS) profile domain-containing protein n=1 Tax=Neonectria punicea TaxID=979145 RepID=A0ABR1GJZ9_9HYPO